MAKMPLMKHQKDMLRVIAPYLKDGTLETMWVFMEYSGTYETRAPKSKIQVKELDGWKPGEFSKADLRTFEELGFFRFDGNASKNGHSPRYILHEYKILEAVESDFEYPEPPASGVTIHNHGGTISGIVSAVHSHVEQNIVQNNRESVVAQIEKQLDEILEQASTELSIEQLESYKQHIEQIRQEVQKANPDNSALQRMLQPILFADALNGATQLFERLSPYLPVLTSLVGKL